jgi:predicted DCC family thiol-disulfide oxidoreductase YuxK
MNKLIVLYDSSCGFCVRCRRWLEHQPKYLDMEFLAADSPEVARRYPTLRKTASTDELIVIDNEGGVYRGAHGWLICLWALLEYRRWSYRLASPLLLPLARRAFAVVSSHRHAASRLFGVPRDDQALLAEIQAGPEPASCATDAEE